MSAGLLRGLYSRNILLFSESDFVHGILIIENDIIADIIILDPLEVLQEGAFPEIQIINHENDYICPGIIDINA
jgi:N-acetylglucosamine-6-phosphate deacetylase